MPNDDVLVSVHEITPSTIASFNPTSPRQNNSPITTPTYTSTYNLEINHQGSPSMEGDNTQTVPDLLERSFVKVKKPGILFIEG